MIQKTEIDLIMVIHKSYECSHFDYLGHFSVKEHIIIEMKRRI